MKSVRKFLAVLMAACLFLTGSAARANAAETTTAAAPETAKTSSFDDEIAAVIGIRRTIKADEALTDLAVMNMKGGYSLPAYQELVKEKKAAE